MVRKNDLTDKNKKEIIDLINKCFDNGIYINYWDWDKFLAVTKGKNKF